MEEHISSSTIIINILIQVANITIFFFLFKYLLWDKISKGLEEREKLIKKLRNADHEYQKILDKAKDESEEIILHAKKHSETILHEWESTAKKRSKAILDEWDNKVKHLLAQAQKDIKKLEESLVKNRTDSLKSTSKLLVKKILGNDKKLQDKYLDTLIDDLKK